MIAYPLLFLFSHYVTSNSLWTHELQQDRLLCPPLSPGVCWNSFQLRWWCYRTIAFAAAPSPSARSLSQHQGLFQCIGSLQQVAKVLQVQATILTMNIQGWFSLGLIGLISLQSKGLIRVFISTTFQKDQSFSTQPSLWSNSHIHT